MCGIPRVGADGKENYAKAVEEQVLEIDVIGKQVVGDARPHQLAHGAPPAAATMRA